MNGTQKEWLTARESAKVMSSPEQEVTDFQVRRLARQGLLEVWVINPRMHLYSRASIERYLKAQAEMQPAGIA